MSRRRDNTPPFEIMGSRSKPSQGSGGGSKPSSAFGVGFSGVLRSITDAWRRSASEPLTLRVPRGMALALIGGLLGLLILSYWVGYGRGHSAMKKEFEQIYPSDYAEGGYAPPDRGSEGGVGTQNQGSGDQSINSKLQDPRRLDFNYLCVARYPQREAERLKRFLEGRGVEVFVTPSNNEGLCQVIVLKGFKADEADARERFRAECLALGREWKAFNNGRGDDLSTMYFDKFEEDDVPH